MDAERRILRTLEAHIPPTASRYVVAFSGGMDSTVLLHALKKLSLRPIVAIHVNHGLHAEADAWRAHCADLCQQWDITFESIKVAVDARQGGLEAAARRARYAALANVLNAGEVLLTAHHQRDQAETLLLQLLRGAGVQGMGGMAIQLALGQGRLLRPLLTASHAELASYADVHSLDWLEDPSNRDNTLDRNFLRHELMPVLRRRWPAADASLARAAGHADEAGSLLEELAAIDRVHCQGGQDNTLAVSALRALTPPRRRNLLRYWIQAFVGYAPSTAQLRRIESDLLTARIDAQPCFAHPDYELRRYREDLYFLRPLPPPPQNTRFSWDTKSDLPLPEGCGRLRAKPVSSTVDGLEPGRFEVRFPVGGERIRPAGGRHHRRLKVLFQERGVPPWVRMRMPLIYHGHELVAVADLWLNADYLKGEGQEGWRPQWLDRPPGWSMSAREQ